jgi:hypothetical protein
MRELSAANDHLGDRSGLDRIWDEQGYLFFRGTLDPDIVRPFREEMVSVLTEHGVAAADGESPAWTGKTLENAQGISGELHNLGLAERFFELPAVQELFEQLLGEPASFVPIVEYRYTTPTTGVDASGFPPHQDGFFNPGIPFRICWVPLMTIDQNIGGLALVPGRHKAGYLHDPSREPKFPIPAGAIPDDAWHRTTYQAGDLLIMHRATPHSGLPNHSSGLRLTMDFRFTAASDPLPVVGEVRAVAPDSITVRLPDGSERAYAVDDTTYVRPRGKLAGSKGAAKVSRKELPDQFPVGERVMVAQDKGKAVLVRTPI